MKNILFVLILFSLTPGVNFSQSLVEDTREVKINIEIIENKEAIKIGELVPIKFSYETSSSNKNRLKVLIFDTSNYTEIVLLEMDILGDGDGVLNYQFAKKGNYNLVIMISKDPDFKKRSKSIKLTVK